MTTNFKNLDYAQIKTSLIEHLKTLKEFQDFDFEASGIQQILSILAYNTAYNAFYLNMVGAEMFLDSAQLRSSVTSRAKAIGYTPSSIAAARAKIRIEIDTTTGPGPANPAFVRLNTTDEFQSYLDGKAYFFTPERTYLIEPNGNGKYIEDVTLIEGKRLKYEYVVDRTSPVKQRFEIPNKNVDMTTLNVRVKESVSSAAITVFSKSGNINLLDSSSLVYFTQENENGLYEVYFGEDVLGVQPKSGNIVILEYVVSSGSAANGLKVFGKINKPTGYDSIKISTLQAAQGGKEQEDIDSIKLLAPLLYESQDRAVTRNDYEALIRKDNPNIQFVRVWGGEENVPADYGRVYASIKPKTGTRLSTEEKALIVNRLLKERNIVSVEVKIVDPEYVFMNLTSVVNFKSKSTTLRAVDIKKAVYDEIVAYKDSVLNGFDADFSHSKMLGKIDSVDRSIVGNVTTIDIKKRIYPAFNSPSRFEINFYNPIDRGDSANEVNSVTSSGYTYRGLLTYIGDDGKGALYLYRIVDGKKVIIQKGIGSVDYEKGLVVIDSLDVQGIPNGDFIEMTAKPVTYDIYTPREAILLLEESDIAVYVKAIDVLGEKA
jgi:hypothetical protein